MHKYHEKLIPKLKSKNILITYIKDYFKERVQNILFLFLLLYKLSNFENIIKKRKLIKSITYTNRKRL